MSGYGAGGAGMGMPHGQHQVPVSVTAQPPPPQLQRQLREALNRWYCSRRSGGQFDASGQQVGLGDNQDAAVNQQDTEGELHDVLP